MPTFKNETDKRLQVEDINERLVTVAPDETVETYKYLPSPDWSVVSDEPYYQIVEAVHTVEAAGAGFEDQAVDPDNHVLELRSDVDLTAHANSGSAEGYPVLADTPVQVRHDGNIGELHLNFSEAGTCVVIEIKD